jgi:hypothetical protein
VVIDQRYGRVKGGRDCHMRAGGFKGTGDIQGYEKFILNDEYGLSSQDGSHGEAYCVAIRVSAKAGLSRSLGYAAPTADQTSRVRPIV